MTIQHTVVFRMNDGADADHFFTRARELATIDGVNDFEILRQVGRKNDFTHGLSMYFDDQSALDHVRE
ncbi:MAG: Dabb family protein [Ilumatobacteraceae bacterium]